MPRNQEPTELHHQCVWSSLDARYAVTNRVECLVKKAKPRSTHANPSFVELSQIHEADALLSTFMLQAARRPAENRHDASTRHHALFHLRVFEALPDSSWQAPDHIWTRDNQQDTKGSLHRLGPLRWNSVPFDTERIQVYALERSYQNQNQLSSTFSHAEKNLIRVVPRESR